MTPYRFTNQALAQSFADRAAKPMMILLGDDGCFWVVTLADGERMIKAGYEVAR